ncbi:hypothetical protein OCGS_0456 [Oceaniovalibus guishaninsula JLT2003]|uniref:UspA domain-containing protein n=1 Tax=Oceaniovalibus guishaninsula JLT2003 TaxID=1231392 RepID=K2GRT9_9RHOB|nr:universal stress protein [Oceaniovalibus guishaninsula]EKE45366.1 hypothetical protein OCGS_0456 [Oceaniovalibus guishaninsula JLT2003]
MFKTILVAVDGSDHSHKAVRYACDLANKYDAALHVVHVPEIEVSTLTLGAAAMDILPTEDRIEALGRPVADKARGWAEAAGRTPDSVSILRGDAAQAILDAVDEKGADLMVSGRRGFGGLRGLLQGSVSQKLASHATCPVLTVR